MPAADWSGARALCRSPAALRLSAAMLVAAALFPTALVATALLCKSREPKQE
jgi:hypothetical protein